MALSKSALAETFKERLFFESQSITFYEKMFFHPHKSHFPYTSSTLTHTSSILIKPLLAAV